MANYKELNEYYKSIIGKELPRATLSKWVKENKIGIEKQNNNYNYNIEDLKNILNNQSVLLKINAHKEKPEDYLNKTVGKLLITGIVPKKEYLENYNGTLMYCDCLGCGKKHIQVRFSYLTKNGNYLQKSCGCDKKIKAFLATIKQPIDEEFLTKFSYDFERYLFIHKMLSHTEDKYYIFCPVEEYKKAILYFWEDINFNKIYNHWKQKEKTKNTYYDLYKPSLDHKLPLSKGGKSELSNLQVLTLFENLSKRDMTVEEWENFKLETNTSSSLFL